MKKLLVVVALAFLPTSSSALTINEIMSNPVGTDDGREWIEVYNNDAQSVDMSRITISIKGGNPVPVTVVQGGSMLPPGGYAIVGSTVSSQTKFLQDYPSYTGILARASISLVNTGATSIDIRMDGVVADSVPTYTAAKEGSSLSKINGSWVTAPPSPGTENTSSSPTEESSQTSSSASQNQVTITQMSPPSPDVLLYVPFEKTIVAGADTEFTVSGMTKAGKTVDNMSYAWAFGDGGRSTGSSTVYRYVYPGHYVARVEGGNGSVLGVASIRVTVVAPEIKIASVGFGKYGSYVDIQNPNAYDIDLSQWKLSINGALYPFPKNTILGKVDVTRFSGMAMGFASTTVDTVTKVSILFPTNEEVTAYRMTDVQKDQTHRDTTTTTKSFSKSTAENKKYEKSLAKVTRIATTSVTTISRPVVQDKKFVTFVKSMFSK
jgi:hypothetical protein